MIRSRFLSTLALAAALALPAYAQMGSSDTSKQPTTTSSASSNPSSTSESPRTTHSAAGTTSGTTTGTMSNATASPTVGSSVTSGTTSTSTLAKCSDLTAGQSGKAHPQAGKLAGKDTGKAKENSASPVHEDCIRDDGTIASASTTK